MQSRWMLRLSMILGVVAFAGPGGAPAWPASNEPAPGVLAMVNGEAIPLAALEQHLSRIHSVADEAERSDFDLDRLMFKLINDVLIGQEARALGMAEDPKIVKKLEELREDLSLKLFEKEKIGDRAKPEEKKIRKTFQEQYRVVQLRTVSSYDEEGARQMLEELRAGEDMEAMALERSVDPIRLRGGLMKPAPRIDLQREVATVAFALAPGELGGPIRTDLGWTVIRVESFADADPERFEQGPAVLAPEADRAQIHRRAKVVRQ